MKSFHPPQRVLMGPGPSDVAPRVLHAMARPTVGHLDPAFQELMEEIKASLARIMDADGYACIPLPAPGTAAMEAAMANLLEPGDRAVIAVNGQFGQRLAEMAARQGALVDVVEQPWGEPVDPVRVEAELQRAPAKLLAFVHAETSTGALSDAAELCRLAARHGALSVVDCVTALGGVAVEAASWGADFIYAGTQKCLSAPPGLAPIAVSPKALAMIQARTSPPTSWAFDLKLLMSYWGGAGGRSYHHTAPVNALYGLHEALVVLEEEGLEASFRRHRRLHLALVAGLEALGLELLVEPAHRLPQLNAVLCPDGVDEAAVRAVLLDQFGLEIGAGLGPLKGRIWRIGLMGTSASPRHVRLCLLALARALAAQGFPASAEQALEAAEARLHPAFAQAAE